MVVPVGAPATIVARPALVGRGHDTRAAVDQISDRYPPPLFPGPTMIMGATLCSQTSYAFGIVVLCVVSHSSEDTRRF